MRYRRTDHDSQYTSVPGSDQEDDQGGVDDEVDEEQLLLDHKNLYWTRLMIIDNYETDHDRKWPLGPDLVEECQAVVDLPLGDEFGKDPLFDPYAFNEEHAPLHVEEYRLQKSELQ